MRDQRGLTVEGHIHWDKRVLERGPLEREGRTRIQEGVSTGEPSRSDLGDTGLTIKEERIKGENVIRFRPHVKVHWRVLFPQSYIYI